MKGDGRWIKISEPEAVALREAGFFDVAERFYIPRARRGHNGGKVFTRAKRKRILERDGYACVFCKGTASLTIDHIVALIDGGSHDDSNLRTLCQPCHRRHDTEVARVRRTLSDAELPTWRDLAGTWDDFPHDAVDYIRKLRDAP